MFCNEISWVWMLLKFFLFRLNFTDTHVFFSLPLTHLLSSKSRLWERDDVQDVGSVQLWDLRRPLLLLPRSMHLHSAEGLRGNHSGQHRRPGKLKHSCTQGQNKSSCFLKAAQEVSVQRLLQVEESLDSAASCSKTHSPFWPLRGSVSARGKDLLWRLVKAIWLLESITIKYCNYPLCLESICNRPRLCSPEKAADTVSVYGKTKQGAQKDPKYIKNIDCNLMIIVKMKYYGWK